MALWSNIYGHSLVTLLNKPFWILEAAYTAFKNPADPFIEQLVRLQVSAGPRKTVSSAADLGCDEGYFVAKAIGPSRFHSSRGTTNPDRSVKCRLLGLQSILKQGMPSVAENSLLFEIHLLACCCASVETEQPWGITWLWEQNCPSLVRYYPIYLSVRLGRHSNNLLYDGNGTFRIGSEQALRAQIRNMNRWPRLPC